MEKVPVLPTDILKTAETRVTDLVVRLGFLGLFAYVSLTLLLPFLPILIWSGVLTAALYPVYAWLRDMLFGRGAVAAFVVTLLGVTVVVGPIAVLSSSLVASLQDIAAGLRGGMLAIPQPPEGLRGWPFVGDEIDKAWRLASTNMENALREYGPSLLPAGKLVLTKIAAITGNLLILLMSVVISGFLFVPGPRLAVGLRNFADRLVRPRGAHFVDLAGTTIRSVSRGVIGIAAIQALLAGVVMVYANVPGAGLLAFAVLVLGIVQIGAGPVLVPVLVWAWLSLPGSTAVILTVLLVPVMVVDNILKPILMGRGLSTPLLVILAGLVGGTLGYGLIGLFLGPIVLAVFYELVVAWVQLEQGDGTENS